MYELAVAHAYDIRRDSYIYIYTYVRMYVCIHTYIYVYVCMYTYYIYI